MIFKQKGFSLLEVLISFILLTVGVIGLIKLQIFIDRKSEYAARSIGALYAAESKLEYFRTRSSVGGGNTISFDSIKIQNTAELINGYQVTWSVVDSLPVVISGVTVISLKEIKVTAEWNDRWGETHGVVLQTMLSRYSEFN